MQWLESIDAFCTLIIHKYEHQARSFNPLLCMHTRGDINCFYDSASLGGGGVGAEHILCTGAGTHEPLLEHTDTSSLCGSSPCSQLKLMLAPSVVSEKGLKVTPALGEGSEQFTTVLLRMIKHLNRGNKLTNIDTQHI